MNGEGLYQQREEKERKKARTSIGCRSKNQAPIASLLSVRTFGSVSSRLLRAIYRAGTGKSKDKEGRLLGKNKKKGSMHVYSTL